MKAYMNDRSRIELAMPIIAIQDIAAQALKASATAEDRHDAIDLGALCMVALKQALDVGTRTHDLAKRAHRAYREMAEPYNEPGVDLKLYGLALYHVLKTMVDQDFLQIGEDDPFKRVLDKFLPAITPDDATAVYDHAKARYGAHEIFTLARKRGLYEGLDIAGLVKEEH